MEDLIGKLQRLTHNELDFVMARSSNNSVKDACKEAGISQSTLYGWDNREELEALALALRLDRHVEVELKLREALPDAVEVVVDGLRQRRYDTKFKAAVEILDRTLGKPSQKVAVTESESESKESEFYQLPAGAIAGSFYDVYRDIVAHRHTEYVFKGGRGSTKSSFTSEVIIELIINNPEWHALVTRQVANTLRDSVYSQLVWAINYLGLSDKFKCTTSPLEITYIPTGQKIYFRGGDDPLKIKSIKPRFGAINLVFFEELDQFHGEAAVRSIIQSALRGDKGYIFKAFNPPRSRNNWVNKYLEIPKPDRYVHESDYRSVPKEWLGQTFLDEAAFLKDVNPDAYRHEYLGEVISSGGLVFENVEIREITDDEIANFDRLYQGLDWGYAVDPLHWLKAYYNPGQRAIYIFDEFRAWKTGNKELYDVLVNEKGVTPEDMLIADSASPKDIADLRTFGLACRGADKPPGSVKYSMRWLESQVKIVVDQNRCPYTAEEILNYEFEQTKDGEYISAYPDRDNHAIDALRYALSIVWRRRGQ